MLQSGLYREDGRSFVVLSPVATIVVALVFGTLCMLLGSHASMQYLLPRVAASVPYENDLAYHQARYYELQVQELERKQRPEGVVSQ